MRYRPFGKTGERVSILGLGGESALYKHSDQAVRIIQRALALGINYFDTAPIYHDSELNYGEVLPGRRKDMFIATKTDKRYYDSAWRQFERSLERLKVDRVDLLQIHHLDFPEELAAVFAPMGVGRMLHEAKLQGLTRYVGVSGHSDPEVLLGALERYPFDSVLMALNPAEVHVLPFQEELLPYAVDLGLGIVAMKVMARGELFRAIPSSKLALSYVLSLPVSTAIVGVMNEAQLVRNARTASEFFPLPPNALLKLEEKTRPFARAINFYRKSDTPSRFPGPEVMPREVY